MHKEPRRREEKLNQSWGRLAVTDDRPGLSGHV
jgi:hypothetical protein